MKTELYTMYSRMSKNTSDDFASKRMTI